MSKIKMVVVPVWLNLIKKELGLSNADLTNWEKLSGILSSRDLLIYRTVQTKREEILNLLLGSSKSAFDFEDAGERMSLEERAACANVSREAMIYGATTAIGGKLSASVEMIDQNTLGLFLCTVASDSNDQELKTDPADLTMQIARALYNSAGLQKMAKSTVFQHAVDLL